LFTFFSNAQAANATRRAKICCRAYDKIRIQGSARYFLIKYVTIAMRIDNDGEGGRLR
jgi:hypothetical protein